MTEMSRAISNRDLEAWRHRRYGADMSLLGTVAGTAAILTMKVSMLWTALQAI
jgi:hypothetical protein